MISVTNLTYILLESSHFKGDFMKVKINKITERSARLYDETDTLIGVIESHLELADARIQIKEQKLIGYYIIFNDGIVDHKIEIHSTGQLSAWPKGFFDLFDHQLEKLLDW